MHIINGGLVWQLTDVTENAIKQHESEVIAFALKSFKSTFNGSKTKWSRGFYTFVSLLLDKMHSPKQVRTWFHGAIMKR